jgi:hypothetical protein
MNDPALSRCIDIQAAAHRPDVPDYVKRVHRNILYRVRSISTYANVSIHPDWIGSNASKAETTSARSLSCRDGLIMPHYVVDGASSDWSVLGRVSLRSHGGLSDELLEKRGFYEKVTDVNSSSLVFPSLGFLFFVSVATHVVLHHVSIRTLYEPEALCRLGFSRRSRCCQF